MGMANFSWFSDAQPANPIVAVSTCRSIPYNSGILQRPAKAYLIE
jgi:hypothetical protein